MPVSTSTPLHVDHITPAWLSSVLGQDVTGFTSEPVGTGQVGDSHRLTVDYERANGVPSPDGDGIGSSSTTNSPRGVTVGPPSVVAKCAATSADSRTAAQKHGWYEHEVRFYGQIAASVRVTVPRVYAAEISVDGGAFLLVLEDLAPAEQGDQLQGCSPDRAALVVEQAAALHAPRWGDPALLELEWLNRGGREWRAFARRMPEFVERFSERYADTLEYSELAAVERLGACAGTYFAAQARPWTIQHGDFRADNLLFAAAGGRLPVAVLDWQTVLLGPGIVDVAYFLGGALSTEDRRGHEERLVRHYHDALRAGGVDGYGWERCWADYRRSALAGLYMAIGSAATVGRTPRGDELFGTMARRHVLHADDLDAPAALGG